MKATASLALVCGLVLALGVSLAGCSKDDSQPRSRVTITRLADTKDDIDLSTAVFESDVLDAGDDQTPLTADDIFFEDAVQVTVANSPASDLLGLRPDGPFSSVTLTSYRVDYQVDGESIAPLTGGLHLVVPTGETATARLVLVTAFAKTQPPLITLVAHGDELTGTAIVTLRGVEQDSNEEIVATAAIAIHFANWADS
jgi:hypothetical protein